MDHQSEKQPTAAPLLAARPRLGARRHSDSAMVPSASSSSSHTHSIISRTARPAMPASPEDPSEHLTPASPGSPSPPCPTPSSHARPETDTATADDPLAERTYAFYTRIPTNSSDLRTIHWRLSRTTLTCVDSSGAPVVALALNELVWRPDGMYGIEFGLDPRFVVRDERESEEGEMTVHEATSVSSSSLGTIGSDPGEAIMGGTASMSQELLAALQQAADMQNNSKNLAAGSTGSVIVHVSDEYGSAIESTDSVAWRHNARPGVMSRPGTAADAAGARAVAGVRMATTDPEAEAQAATERDGAGYVEGFRIYSENALEVTNWLNILAAYRTSHPLIPRVTYASADSPWVPEPIDSYESLASPANTRRSSAAIGNPESLMATVASHLHNPTPAAVRVTTVTAAATATVSLTPPGSVGSLSATSDTSAKFIRILDAAHGPVVVSSTAGGRVVVKSTATGKTVLDVRDSLEMLHDKMGGPGAESPQLSLGSLQSVDSANKIPLAGFGKPAVVGYNVPLKGEGGVAERVDRPLGAAPAKDRQEEDKVADVDGDDTLGNAQWKALKSGGAVPEPAHQEPVVASKTVVTGHPEPKSTTEGETDDEEAMGDTLKGSGSAMRLKGAVVAAAELTRQDAFALGDQLGM